ncbi:ABC transporter substrate-binding protein [uncultured Clostridium sp.]|uniref:ABC transporter substrate-binding protein n=1 Tax=uncultured Clostridium sp. TaxID=59620 RepID=UPI0025ED2FD5|nr:ABC transporter substrate-binding protein [uncultured Clostridium sp.]
MKKRGLSVLLAAAVTAGALAGCSSQTTSEAVDLNSMSVDAILTEAKKEGRVDSVGMPDTWANWIETWEGIKTEYGLEHTDTDMSSAEEISLFEAEKKKATKDIGDVGQAFGPIAEEKGVTLKYKTSYWDSIPDWAKDDDGDWIIGYYGTMTMMTNKKLVKEAPKSFADLLEGDYKIAVGDVSAANQAQFAVLAAAIAMGGDESNIKPGLDFFKQIAEQGRLDLGEFSMARIEKGEVGVAFLWDYNALGYRDQFVENNPNADFEINIPLEGSIQSGYCTILNAYSQRPHAAAMAREYILSDEGQINLAKGYARPVRDVELPQEVKEKMLPDEQYENSRMVKDQAAWDKTTKEIGAMWQEEVVAYAK